ncbi:MAG: hypothetical protein V1754_01820 [Pseudomonadota bacterium]
MKIALRYVGPLLAVGAASLIWQVASARAVMAGLYGNELTFGLVLGSWLVLMGGATGATARFCKRHHEPLLAQVLALMPAGILASIWLQQVALPGFSTVGQVVGPGRALVAVLVCLIPCCVLFGAGFGLISLAVPANMNVNKWAARIYLVEGLGIAGAGILFHVWLAKVSLLATGMLAGILPWVLAFPLTQGLGKTWRKFSLLAMIVGSVALAYLVPGSELPGAENLLPRVPGYKVIEQKNSQHAALSILWRGDQVLFLANGLVVFTNQDEQQAEFDVHLGLLAHPNPKRVLMIGGGLGGGLEKALLHPVQKIEYVELDPTLITLAQKWGGHRVATALKNRRVHLQIGDGRQIVAQSSGLYDAILVGVPGPYSALTNRFFTDEFFKSAKKALSPRGLIRVSLPGSETYLGDEMALVHATVFASMKKVFGNCIALPATNTLFLAGREKRIDLSFSTLFERYKKRKIKAQFFGRTELIDRTLPFKREFYQKRLAQVGPLANTDLNPGAYFHSSLTWLAVTSKGLSRALGNVAEFLANKLWLVPICVFVFALLGGFSRRKQGGADFAIFTAGFSGLAIELCLLLALQEIRGVVYHEIGALLAAFMVGLAFGALLGNRMFEVWPHKALQVAVGSCAATSLLAVAFLHLGILFPQAALFLFLSNMLFVGMAVGACYPPVAALIAKRYGPGSGAARAYAWDLLGAATGAFLATGFALPVLGLPGTCLMCAALCSGVTVSFVFTR